MENINRLTAASVKTAGEGRHNDGGYLWLYVRGAAKSWVFYGPRVNGKQVVMGLGSINRVSLAQARRLRDEKLTQLRDGRNPLAEKQALANRKTFREVADTIIDGKVEREDWRVSFLLGRSSTLGQWRHDVDVVLAPIASKLLDEITIEDIEAIVRPMLRRKHYARAKALLGRIAAVFAYAAHKKRRWFTGENPASKDLWEDDLKPPQSHKPRNHASLPYTEVPALTARLRASDAVAARILEFAILTATRSQEARGARWSEIDFERKVWTIPGERMKKALPHEVPLSKPALALLHRMLAEHSAAQWDGDFVFPGGRGLRQGADKAMRHQAVWAYLQRLTANATVHGFRSSFTIWAKHEGVSKELADRCLAHEDGDRTDQAYGGIVRDQLTEKRRAVMEAWARFVDDAPAADNVLPFRAA